MTLARLLTAFLLAAGLAGPVHAQKVLRYASAFDPGTMDPHSLQTAYNARVLQQIYDSLTGRDENWKLEGRLALSWSVVPPHNWRFKLRPNVKFHDGTPFTAEDVVFNIERALSASSGVKNALPNVTGAKVVDPLTVDLLMSSSTPSLPLSLTNFRLLSKAWALRNHAERPQNFQAKEDAYSARHAVGTGPFQLERYETDVKTTLTAFPGYWGRKGNVSRAEFLVVSSAATRLAGLISGEIDFMPDAALQDIDRLEKTAGVKVLTGPSIQTQFLGFDHARDKLLYADAGAKNPFKDKRVRQAVRYGIDFDALTAKIMRKLTTPGSALYTPAVDGYDKRFDQYTKYEPEKAKALLKEAGYPDGFGVTLNCSAAQPADAICQAVTGMLARIGIRVSYQPLPFNNLVPKVTSRDVSFYSIGWTPSTDAEGPLSVLAHSPKGGLGEYNAGNYLNPKVDQFIEQGMLETDPAKRSQAFTAAMSIIDEEAGYITLVYRRVFWSMRNAVRTPVRPNDAIDLRFVTID